MCVSLPSWSAQRLSDEAPPHLLALLSIPSLRGAWRVPEHVDCSFLRAAVTARC
jgi:hypothetical protein